LFRFLDCNENNQVSINELCTLIESIEVSLQEKMNSFSPEFENQLKREIIELFEMIDTDHDNFLRADEIVKFI
jgi:Ca2+-binding EF-hand superfamily protein